jgi:DNA-binding MarR family transcriptional regulator/N-acetylglutamate synthase-like GNAT family acetyltransferase
MLKKCQRSPCTILDVGNYLFDNGTIMTAPTKTVSMEAGLDERVAAMRAFNRFYTKQIGVLTDELLRSPYSLTEARVLYELAHRDQLIATQIGKELGLDAGYLSRILRKFEKRRLLARSSSDSDGRHALLSLTTQGRKAFAMLDARSHDDAGAMLRGLPLTEQSRMIKAMLAIQSILDGVPKQGAPYLLRTHQPGDMGWVVHRHGVLYAQEYGYDENFEALVAGIVAEFIQNFDPKKERCWIAEKDGEIVGSIFLVKKSKTVAKLRLLLVEPSARGLGIGSRLIAECIRFARQAGYRQIILWTQSDLDAARHLYKKAGFHVVDKKPHHSFGHDLVAETWELMLKES